jgi:hypothetical protein
MRLSRQGQRSKLCSVDSTALLISVIATTITICGVNCSMGIVIERLCELCAPAPLEVVSTISQTAFQFMMANLLILTGEFPVAGAWISAVGSVPVILLVFFSDC